MKSTNAIIFGFIFSTLSLHAFSQSTQVQGIKAYRASVDSLHDLYDSLHRSLSDTSAELLTKMKLTEGIAEGVYRGEVKNIDTTIGGFSVYPFLKGDKLCRIVFSGGKRDAYVTKAFYYQNNHLVFAEMTVRRWQDKIREVYKVEEYFWQGKKISGRKTNAFPLVKDKSLIPTSLFKDGMTYFAHYNNYTNPSRR